MKNDLITIILPCYKSEYCIGRMLDCILSQSYTSWDLLAVSNGPSQSAQLKIIAQYEQKDMRIRHISVLEPGLSNARNIGIENVKGRWFTFVDADDEITPDHLQKFVDVIDEDSELIIGGYTLIRTRENSENTHFLQTFDSKDSSNIKAGLLKYIQMEETIASASWNKLHKTSLIRGLGLTYNTEITTYEDTVFYLQLMKHLKRIQFVPSCGYKYICTDEASIQSKWHPDLEQIFEKLALLKAEVRFLAGFDEKQVEIAEAKQLFMDVYWVICNLYKPGCYLCLSQKREVIKRRINDPDFIKSLSYQDRSTHNGLIKLFDFAVCTNSSWFIALFFAFQYKVKSLLGPYRGYVMKLLRR